VQTQSNEHICCDISRHHYRWSHRPKRYCDDCHTMERELNFDTKAKSIFPYNSNLMRMATSKSDTWHLCWVDHLWCGTEFEAIHHCATTLWPRCKKWWARLPLIIKKWTRVSNGHYDETLARGQGQVSMSRQGMLSLMLYEHHYKTAKCAETYFSDATKLSQSIWIELLIKPCG